MKYIVTIHNFKCLVSALSFNDGYDTVMQWNKYTLRTEWR